MMCMREDEGPNSLVRLEKRDGSRQGHKKTTLQWVPEPKRPKRGVVEKTCSDHPGYLPNALACLGEASRVSVSLDPMCFKASILDRQ